jgi:hypothetical protein
MTQNPDGSFTDGEYTFIFHEDKSVTYFNQDVPDEQSLLPPKGSREVITVSPNLGGGTSLYYQVCVLGDYYYTVRKAIGGGSTEWYGLPENVFFSANNSTTGESRCYSDLNAASVIYYADRFYYIELDFRHGYFPSGQIFSINPDMNDKQLLTDNAAAYYFCIMDDMIYYIDYDSRRLYRVSLDGTENKPVLAGELPEDARLSFGDWGAGYSIGSRMTQEEVIFNSIRVYYGNHLFTFYGYDELNENNYDVTAALSFDVSTVLTEVLAASRNADGLWERHPMSFYQWDWNTIINWNDEMVLWYFRHKETDEPRAYIYRTP